MIRWHETLAARFGLRLAGAAILFTAWLTGLVLYAHVHAHPPRPASFGELGLCAALVVLTLVGNALLVMGPGLWKRVAVPAPRHAALSPAYELGATP